MFLTVNMQFVDRIIEVVSSDNNDLVIAHNYHLWVFAKRFWNM